MLLQEGGLPIACFGLCFSVRALAAGLECNDGCSACQRNVRCMHTLLLHTAGHCAEVFADRLVPVMICYTKALDEPLAVLISV
jgi:hypothetical protein